MNERKLLGKRKEVGLTQEQIAKEMGINPATYNLKEQGKREFTASELVKLCKILNVDINYFFEK